MHDLPLITTIATAFTMAWLCGLLAQWAGLSPIVGYLVAGIIIGPHTPGFQGDIGLAKQLAEIGVILLMFDVGLHFSLKKLLSVRAVAIPGAVGQSLVATLLGVAVCVAFGYSPVSGMVVGMAMAVASTVVLMRVLMDAQVLDSPQGHVAVGWLLVEDIFTVVVLVMIPVLGGGEGGDAGGISGLLASLGVALVMLTLLVVILLLAGARIIPWILVWVARLRSRELFTLTVLVFSVAIAAASYTYFGASMALGAFLAGMVVAQSPVSHQAAADALPMRDTFAVIFFVSVGMLFDPHVLIRDPLFILAGLAIVFIAKPLTALIIVAVLGHSARTALTVAVGLAQVGEFSFVLSELASHHGLMPEAGQNMLIAVAILSISLNPLLFRSLDSIERWLRGRPFLWNLINARAERRVAEVNRVTADKIEADARPEKLAIVVGFGPVGRSVDNLLREAGMKTVIIEMNMDTVLELTESGRTALFGDASREAILKQAGIDRASHLIVTMPQAAQRSTVVSVARYLNPRLRILVRAHYLAERDALEHAGASGAVFEEAEAAIALARLVLAETGANREAIDRSVRELRLRLILENVSNLSVQQVRSIMVPWTRVGRLLTTDHLKDVRRKVSERRYSRWPVLEPSNALPTGYLLTKDLIVETSVETDWVRLIRPVTTVKPDDDIESTLQHMQSEGATICIVADHGSPVGLITIEDILEQVVGRIEDEYPRETAVFLRDLFSAGGVKLEVPGPTLDEAIVALSAMIPAGSLPADAHVTEMVIAREHQLSTHVGFGVAIPHASCPHLTEPLGVLGRSLPGVQVSADAKERAHLIFLLVTPAERPELHVHILGQLAAVAGQPAVREALLRASSAKEMLDIISEADPATEKSRQSAPAQASRNGDSALVAGEVTRQSGG